MSALAMAPWRQYVPAGVLALGCALLLSVRSQEGVAPAADRRGDEVLRPPSGPAEEDKQLDEIAHGGA